MTTTTMEPQTGKVWTYKELFPTLERIVQRDPLYVDPGEYGFSIANPDGTASCLVGALVYKIDNEEFSRLLKSEWGGRDLDALRQQWKEELEYDDYYTVENYPFEEYIEPNAQPGFKAALVPNAPLWSRDNWEAQPGLTVTPKAYAFLAKAQAMQDSGHTWGEALQAAKEAAEGLDD